MNSFMQDVALGSPTSTKGSDSRYGEKTPICNRDFAVAQGVSVARDLMKAPG